MERKSGILMPVSALPSKYGIGSFGKWAYKFVDFLKASDQSYWQMLPLVMTGYCDSPYQTACDVSGNPYFIDLETLRGKRLLTYREVESAIDKSEYIDYGKLYNERYALLRKAYSRFDKSDAAFRAFVKDGKYRDYSLFMALAKKFGKPWYEWDAAYKLRDPAALDAFFEEEKEEVLFWQFLQFEFWSQYYALKKYANQKGVKIIGDLPLYLAYDSVEVWSGKENFYLDENLKPKKVAGVPPDYFSEDGQLWGNPVYDYGYMWSDGFKYWKKRLEHARQTYDVVRIDHFRGLDRFWVVDPNAPNARNGEWWDAAGREIFKDFDTSCVIAEDLGVLDDGVKSLISDLGLPGMKILEFAFGSDDSNAYLPWNVGENSVVYTGTHDNDTLVGYLKSLPKEQLEKEKILIKKSLDYLGIYKPLNGIYATAEAILHIAFACRAKLVVTPIQDFLFAGSELRVNNPGLVGCWRTRIKESVFTDNLVKTVKRLTKRYKR